MRLPKLSTLLMITLAAVMLLISSVFAIGRLEHWSLNETTCMPIGFYQRGPAPKNLRDGDRIFLCPPVHERLTLPFIGPTWLLRSAQTGINPAMREAITGRWLDFTPQGKWSCPDHLMPFAKIVAATAGQTVEITRAGVVANGKLLPNSRIVTHVDGIPVVHLPIGFHMVIPRDYFWDYAPGDFAFTSAYYGPVPVKNILGSLRPALVIPGSQYWYTPTTEKQ
ncbi:S26 family signal peptidase [Acidithiobacillus sp. YTS05]|nr:S26 family signal peptidase [Acidithiobacillus sp. YTS05]